MAKLPAFETAKKRKSTNEATASTKRKIMLVVELLTQRRVRFSLYHEKFGLGF